MVFLYSMTTTDPGAIDRLDAALIELLATQVPYRILHLARAAVSDSGPAC
jgi:hypothetical protein